MTAISLVAWRRIQGDPCFRIPEATFALIEGYLRQRPDAIATPILKGEQVSLIEKVCELAAEAA
ncbi:hypothetical protein [Sphingorhabdus sp. SMR4y]|uniref:hypothetical protein n=1 Tax=Sphingorhabdus sp. SMR4y TaxID=2584094 RepID=UPI0011AB4B63|nr:hypothetical protein [Sphingorhabdus sp. SMR4y]